MGKKYKNLSTFRQKCQKTPDLMQQIFNFKVLRVSVTDKIMQEYGSKIIY